MAAQDASGDRSRYRWRFSVWTALVVMTAAAGTCAVLANVEYLVDRVLGPFLDQVLGVLLGKGWLCWLAIPAVWAGVWRLHLRGRAKQNKNSAVRPAKLGLAFVALAMSGAFV